MIRFVLFILAFYASFALSAQNLSLCQQVIGATGYSGTESGLHYTYTVGEPIIFTLKKQGTDIVLTQGFHQPDVCLPVSTDDQEQWSGWDIQAYPNPAMDQLTVQFTAPLTIETLSARVVNTLGQVVLSHQTIQPNGAFIPCAGLSSGVYFLILVRPDTNAFVSIPFIKG